MYPGIELRTMRYIVAVGKCLHFSRAADHVHVAQPSLSKQIRNVEGELGVELFKRTRRKVEITDPGREYIRNAELSLLYADRAAATARAAGAGVLGKLLLGVSPSVDMRLFFRIRAGFLQQYSDVEVEFTAAFAMQQAEWIMSSELHAGLVELPIRYRGLAILSIYREPLLFAVPRKSRMATVKHIQPAHLKDTRLILITGNADIAHETILNRLHAWGYRPEKVIPVMTLPHALDVVAAGEGIAILRAYAERIDWKGVILQPVPDLPMLDIGLAYRRNNRAAMITNLIQTARQVFEEERTRMKAAVISYPSRR